MRGPTNRPRKRTKLPVLIGLDPFTERCWVLVFEANQPDPLSATGYFLNKIMDTQEDDAKREMIRRGTDTIKVSPIQIWRSTKTEEQLARLAEDDVYVERYGEMAVCENFKDLTSLIYAVEADDRPSFE